MPGTDALVYRLFFSVRYLCRILLELKACVQGRFVLRWFFFGGGDLLMEIVVYFCWFCVSYCLTLFVVINMYQSIKGERAKSYWLTCSII